MTEGRELSREEIIPMLATYERIRREERKLGESKRIVSVPIRDYLEHHREEGDLWDGETKIKAWLQPRKGEPQLDGANIPAELLVWLGQHGCLRLDNAALKALNGKFPETLKIQGYIYVGEGSEALQVRREET